MELLVKACIIYILILLTPEAAASHEASNRGASKILVLPFGIRSHMNIFNKLGAALNVYGHEVWMLAFDKYVPLVEAQGLTPINLTLKPQDDLFGQLEEWLAEDPTGEGMMARYMASDMVMAFSRVCDDVMTSDVIMGVMEREKFDLVIFDGTEHQLCYLMISYRYDIPFITVHGFQTTAWVSGVTGMPSIEPEIDKALSNRMNFWERIDNLHSWWERYNSSYYDLYQHHMDNYCPPHKPKIPLKQVSETAEMYLMNYEVLCLDYPRVSAPNMQYLGGSTATPPQPLPEDLETYITEAEHGVVLMTLGSMKAAQYLWMIMGPKLFPAFGRLPQRVIVQYRLDTVYGEVPPNVKLMKWMPQNDILGHPNVKLFVMHGGNNGQNEAIYHGVPMLVIPVQFDQIYTGKRVEVKGYGKMVHDKTAVTSEELYDMMREILTNQTYSHKTKKCSAIVRSMPTAQEKFVFWVNHILQFGGAHLRPPSLDMPLAYYGIMALAAFHAAIFVLYLTIKFLRKYFKTKKD